MPCYSAFTKADSEQQIGSSMFLNLKARSGPEQWMPINITRCIFWALFPEWPPHDASDASPTTLVKLISCAIHSGFVEGWFYSGNGWHFPGPAVTCLRGLYSCMKTNSGQRSLADMQEAQILQTHRAQTESNWRHAAHSHPSLAFPAH